MPPRSTKTDNAENKPAQKTPAQQRRVPPVQSARIKSPAARKQTARSTVPVMVAKPELQPLTTHKEIQGFVIRAWIVMLGLVSLVGALGVALWGSADQVGSEMSYIPPVHQTGKVAGVTVGLASAPVTVRVHDGANIQTYEIVTAEQLSVYNVLRSAQQSTVLTADMQTNSSGSVSITKLAGIPADATHRWQVLLDGKELASLSDPTVVPGSALDFQLVPR